MQEQCARYILTMATVWEVQGEEAKALERSFSARGEAEVDTLLPSPYERQARCTGIP